MQPEQRRLSAILAADVAGYSRLMAADELGTLARLKRFRTEVIEPKIAQFQGRMVGSAGDSVLVEFASALNAVQCAVEIQAGLGDQNANLPEDRRMAFRMGVNLGDVIPEDDTIHGDGVNIAARLEKLAEPGSVCIGANVYDQVKGKLAYAYADLGEQRFHNIPEPVRAYRVKPSKFTGDTSPGFSTKDALPLPDKPSIAVLPFQSMSGDPEQDYFADGMVEEIITALSRVRWLFVVARNSSFTYKSRAVDVRQVGRELGVRYVLEGSVRKAGNRIRITGQLIDTTTGAHLWADRFDGALENIFDLQDQVTASVVGAIEPNVRHAEINRMRAKPTADLTSYDLYLQALPELYNHTAESFKRAEMLLRSAIERDSDYADAIAVLAISVARQSLAGWKPYTEGLKEALELSRRAVLLDNASAEVLATGADCEAMCGGSFERSEELAMAALRANPNSIQVQMLCGGAFVLAGVTDRAIELYQTAWRMNPIDPQGFLIMRGLGIAHFFARRFDAAVSWESRVLGQHPDDNIAKRYLAASLAHLGRITEAREVIADLLRSQPSSSLSRSRQSTFGHRWMTKLYIEGLCKAGLPE